MSTVAYKDGVIACDSQVSNGSEYQNGIMKIGRTRRFLFGFAGRLGAMRPSYDWLLRIEDRYTDIMPEEFYRWSDELGLEDEDGTILIADRSGNLWTITTGGYVVPHPRRFEAIGSGGAYSVGAMVFGASAVESVEVAKALDTGTSGQTFKLSFNSDELVIPGMKIA